MNSLAAKLNLGGNPASDADFIGECSAAWAVAHQLLIARQADDSSPDACVQLFKALCHWRLRAAQKRHTLSAEARECGFVITCAARLVLMDTLFDTLDAGQLATFHAALQDWQHVLKDAEAARVVSFTPPQDAAEVERELDARALRWSVEPMDAGCAPRCQFWSRCAMALIFSRKGRDVPQQEDSSHEVAVETTLLKALSFYDHQCVQRDEVRHLLTAQRQPAAAVSDAVLESADRWAKLNTSNVGDELYALGKECRLLLSVTPYALVMSQQRSDKVPTNYAKVMADWTPAAAIEAHAQVATGFGILRDDDAPHEDPHKSVCFLNLFDYCMQQLYDVHFAKLFFVHDVVPGAVLSRVDAYVKDNIVNPAPLLVLSLHCWWLVYRTRMPGAVAKTECYASCREAVCAWLAFVRDNRRGVLFLGKPVDGLIAEVCANTAQDAGRAFTLPTTAVE